MIGKRIYILLVAVAMLVGVVGVEAKSYRVKDIPNVHLKDRTRFVSNPDGILSGDAVARIDSICYSLKERGIAEVVVVAVDNIKPADMFSFSQDLFTSWGVGNGELNNGLGILLVKDMRSVRFHTGYGLEGVLPDATCVQIQQDFMSAEWIILRSPGPKETLNSWRMCVPARERKFRMNLLKIWWIPPIGNCKKRGMV